MITYRKILDDLHATGLLKLLGELAAEMLGDARLKPGEAKTKLEFSRPVTAGEEYGRRTLLSAGELLSVCEQMALATEFLSGYRQRKHVEGDPITRFDHIVYHLENHLIRSTSVADRSLLLTNMVMRLGLAEEDCRFRTITRNEHVAGSKIDKALRALDKLLTPTRQLRNVVIHKRKHSEEQFAMIEQFYVLQKIELRHRTPDAVTKRYQVGFKTLTDAMVAEKKKTLAAANVQIFSAIQQLFAALEPAFIRRHTLLKNAG